MSEFWINDPLILFQNCLNFNPFCNTDFNEKLNATTRFIIIVTIILFSIHKDNTTIFSGLFLIILIIIIYIMFPSKDNFVELGQFLNDNNNTTQIQAKKEISLEQLPKRKPEPYDLKTTNNNPLMNPSFLDFDNTQKYSGATINNDLNTFISNKLFQTPGDYLFDKESSQRQLYSVSGTTVPNKQGEFASWLYGSESNCKEGSIYMRRAGTRPESQLCTGFDIGGPLTNFGKEN